MRSIRVLSLIIVSAIVTHPAVAQFSVPPPPSLETVSVEEILGTLRKSPSFKAEFPANQLQQRKLAFIPLRPEIGRDMQTLVSTTSFRAMSPTKALFQPELQAEYLRAPPVYEETVIEMTDRMVINRRVRFTFKPGACRQKLLPSELKSFCFQIKGKGDVGLEAKLELQQIRSWLKTKAPTFVVQPGITAGYALRLSDEDLLDAVLNQGERAVSLLSEAPHALAVENKLAGGNPETAWTADPVEAAAASFYFLTGFTVGGGRPNYWQQDLGCAWGNCYWVQAGYYYGAYAALRFPFEGRFTAVADTALPETQNVQVKFRPIDVSSDGTPVFPAVGLDPALYLGGNEVIFELNAYVYIKASIPGPDIYWKTPDLYPGMRNSLTPPFGSKEVLLGNIWLPYETTNLGIFLCVAGACGGIGLDVGVGAKASDGRIGLKTIVSYCTAFVESGSNYVSISKADSNPVEFSIRRRSETEGCANSNYGLTFTEPEYNFRLWLMPAAGVRAYIDAYDYEWKMELGPYNIDWISTNGPITLPRHAGTLSEVPIFWGGVPTPIPPPFPPKTRSDTN